jgi:hypothetical protein
MAVNQRIEYLSGDVAAGQLAPSQAHRTQFTPGTTSGGPNDMNWPTDYRIPTSTPNFNNEVAGPVLITRSVVVKLARNIVSDQTVQAPVAGVPEVTTIVDHATWGVTNPVSVLTPTNTQIPNGTQERRTGYNTIESA